MQIYSKLDKFNAVYLLQLYLLGFLWLVVSYAACSRVRGFLPTYRLLTAATHSIPIVST